ncbi:hypothetical protein OAM31_02020 [Pelagibacteraceae bacterium]|nr:hypothetical protein [Pelagibacteraceae bacterium]
MKKIFFNLILSTIIIFFSLVAILSTVGIETNKFNKFISQIASKGKNIDLDLKTIKFKIDLKEISLFLETENPKIAYRSAPIPARNIKVYIDFLSLLTPDPKIKKLNIIFDEIDITRLNNLSAIIKPSNFKNILKNKIKKGKLKSEIEIFLTDKGNFDDFITKGTVVDLEAQLDSELFLKQTSLSFFADKTDILVKNIFGNLEDIEISGGDIKINLENGIKFNSNFNSKINLDEKLLHKYSNFLNNIDFQKNIKSISADLNNSISMELDSTYKVKNYNYGIIGKIEKSKIELEEYFKNSFITEQIKTIYLSDLQIKSIISPKKINFNGEGKYSFNNSNFLKINLSNNFDKNSTNLKLNLDFINNFEIDLINYKKPKNSIANLDLDLEKRKGNVKIKKLYYKEENNFIKINELQFEENKYLSFKNVEVSTRYNDFKIQNKKKITISGDKFDATNLTKFFKNQNSENKFQKLSSNIEIEFRNIKVPLSETIKNFRLIGEIKQGKFIKISSKGDFGGQNYLDISMKKDRDTDKKYLEIYSDLTRPLLTEYSFFNGLSGGKLLFTSIIDESKTNSKLKIENFKVINAPGLIKLLSLADLGGLVDLAEGDGLSFDILEINVETNNNFLKINEMLALGPSMSVLMEGYQDENGLTSLRGTLVPAKTLNRIISKIPVIGNIIIPKEVGEGLFGISFKMKGPKGNIKTVINPIKTLTPRFIQKIIERNKQTK